MAWPPRFKNSRSSAQPGTYAPDGVQATVTPAPGAEPLPGSGQNTGVSGTRHAVASGGAHGPGARSPRPGRRLRAIRYAHSGSAEEASPAAPVRPVRPADEQEQGPGTPAPDIPASGTVLSGTVLSGVVLPDRRPPGQPAWPVAEQTAGYDQNPGPVFEPARPASTVPPRSARAEEPARPSEPVEPVPNEGLGIFGGVATTEASDDPPARRADRQPRFWQRPSEPPGADPRTGRVPAVGATWNQPITSPPVPSEGAEERKARPFFRMREFIRGDAGADNERPRVSVRDLPPDVQVHLWRVRAIIMVVTGAVFAALTRSWEIAVTLAILAGIADTVYRARNAAYYVMAGPHPGARKETSKQLARMRREGYYTLNERRIPNSPEVIDHLVIGPTGVYAIDSERWNPKLPIRISNGKRLYLGPESQKERLDHAVWEASQASEILSRALGYQVPVRPALAIYGPQVPWDVVDIRNVDVFTGSALRKYLKSRGRKRGRGVPALTPEEVLAIYEKAAAVLPDVTASPRSTTPVG